MTEFVLDSSVRRAGDGRVLVGGSPLTLLRLTAAGAALFDRLANGQPIPSGPDGAANAATGALVDRLLDAGVIHPRPISGGPTAADVTVVIPAFAVSSAALTPIVAACAGTAAVVVVDDASPHPVEPLHGATVVRHDVNAGPAAARATGLATVRTPFVAFVDTDVHLGPNWLTGLIAHFADVRVGLVAPRIASVPGRTAIDRYEAVRSPLDLGNQPARVRAGTRVSYVPSAAIVCRVAALSELGGFDERFRFGEDVDLVWRLDEAGWRVRYEPAVVVHHDPRPTLARLLVQRFRYGSSAAPLAERHPGALAPVRVSAWSAGSWLLAAAGFPVVGVGVAGITTAMLARRLREVPDGRRQALRLAGLGHLYAGRSLASGLTRAWWPAALAAAVVSRRARRVLVAAIVIPAALDYRDTRPALDPVRYTAMRVVDDAAYGSGLIVGAVRARSIAALLPDFRSWPNQRRSRP